MTEEPQRAREAFLNVFRRHATGVAVITTGGEHPTGFTASSVASLSVEPPMLTFNMSKLSSSWASFAQSEFAIVHLLTERQEAIARTFATSGVDRVGAFGRTLEGPQGLPMIPDVMAWLLVRIHDRVEFGNHAVIVCDVLDGQANMTPPLTHQARRYGGLR